MIFTLTVSTSSGGTRTKKWKASSHRGDVERSQTFFLKINRHIQDCCRCIRTTSVWRSHGLTLVLFETPLRIISAPTFGSFPFFFNWNDTENNVIPNWQQQLGKKHKVYDLTGRPCARSTYTNSTPADGTTLFWYDCWDWYCRICRRPENVLLLKDWFCHSYQTSVNKRVCQTLTRCHLRIGLWYFGCCGHSSFWAQNTTELRTKHTVLSILCKNASSADNNMRFQQIDWYQLDGLLLLCSRHK